jgi:4-hydroxy-tetrahydrodipicolinate reductase
MSLGVNVISQMARMAVPALEDDFDVEIIEKHHGKKSDAPSGTALLLAEAIREACREEKNFLYGRHGKDGAREPADIGIHAIRGGTHPGEHMVLFMGPDEIIEIKHTVFSKNVFALGAIKAARFICDKPPGLYDMRDLLAAPVV